MTSRRDIAIQTFDGLTLRGWFYSAGDRRPCVILTHGTVALKEQYLPDFAECFQALGYGALVYDNRHFGASDGEPRSHADPLLQSRDYSATFNYAASLAEVNLPGSYSGVAVSREGLRCTPLLLTFEPGAL
ncbi:hypothetical protein CNMCM8927_001418 [Aspergillus lentulus]|uniref:Serine aminopeptidase S33 domain-containing protein n=1 Tax=Aspergillus lentulus TaxID=293939 RepID=A0AAN6BM21_ASPLE|nr:hypothetical protein CNMCM8060_001626 [Aspergillus lentulus]KAF4191932.1 hypothetical protein CNMCM8694_001103 [Aspergillus lentulus]KAF4201523.1 hypothetical protein CNMCM8927_001418 [Aspergillus lentulus]